jgi:branched-chain amino acid transport system substrate-binding protein
MRTFALAVMSFVLLGIAGQDRAQGASPSEGSGSGTGPSTGSTRPEASPPTVRVGALLPLSGLTAAYGKDMRQGMELAIEQLNRPRRAIPTAEDINARAGEDQKAAMAAQRANREGLPSPGVTLALDVADVDPLNVKQATDAFTRLAATRVTVVFTASTTPTLTVQPQASARNILLVHQGPATARPPASSRMLVQTRPSIAQRVEGLVRYAREHGLRRLALLAAGDEFGKTVRATLSTRWREAGAALTFVESLSLDAPDVAARLRQLVRVAPEAVVLGFQGLELGELAARLRAMGYVGPLLVLDDDRAARLAAGIALEGATLVTEAFVPEGNAGTRFVEAYAAKFGTAPSRYAANAYEAVAFVAEGIRVARQQGRGIPGGARLRDTLETLGSVPSVYRGYVRLREDGTVDRPLGLFAVEGGEVTFVRYSPASDAPEQGTADRTTRTPVSAIERNRSRRRRTR